MRGGPGWWIGMLGLVAAPAPAQAARGVVPEQPEVFTLLPGEKLDLARRQITVRHEENGSLNEFFSAGYVNAPVDKVFAFYEEYRNTPKFQDSIKDIKPVIVEPNYRQLEYWMSLPWPIGIAPFPAGSRRPGDSRTSRHHLVESQSGRHQGHERLL